MSAARVPVIGIVGGIGSGKTALAGALERYCRCCRLDADAAGHRALELDEVKEELRNEFGNEVFDSQGGVLRAQLAKQVFGAGDEKLASRRKLERIVHPWIERDIREQLEEYQQSGMCDLILLDAALLLEAGWHDICNAVVFLDVPLELRRKRTRNRGWNSDEFERREASQMDLETKRKRADHVIDNAQPLDAAAADLAAWLEQTFHLPIRSTPTSITP